MQGVLGCLFAMGVMLLMPGTEMKAQAAYTPPTTKIQGIMYRLFDSERTCQAIGYDASDVGTEVHIPATIEYSGSTYRVTEIYRDAFAGSSLQKITLEEELDTIDERAFQNTQLTEIEIPASVTTINRQVFDGCRSLTKIRFRGTTPPQWLAYSAFAGISGPITIQIPQGANANDWETALQGAGLASGQYTIQIGTPSSGGDSSSGSSSTPSPAKQGGGEAAEEEPANRIPEHVCQYEWETVREAGAGQDGLEQYLCKLCGSVQSTLTIPASQYQVQELYTKVTGAAEGETVTYDMGQIHTVCDKLFTKLQERSDVTLILTYWYKGQDYQTTFPAGADYTELIEDEEQFYGMLGLKGRCGIVTE